MNTALLAKWLFRIECGESSMCINLLRTKYLGQCSLFQKEPKSCSFFWTGLNKVRDWYNYGRGVQLGNGNSTRFWADVWRGDCALNIRFPRLFRICRENVATVEGIISGRQSLSFRRNLGVAEKEELSELQELTATVRLREESDVVTWKLENSGKYSARSLYRFIVNPGCVDLRMVDVWNTRVPLKIQIFLWMVWHDRVQTTVQLKKRKWGGQIHYKLCGEMEDLDHLFFNCPVALFVWCWWVRDSLGWSCIPASLGDFQDDFLGGPGDKDNRLTIFLFAGVSWALWRTRNDWVFDDLLVKHPNQIVHRAFGFLQYWCRLSTKGARTKMEELLTKLHAELAKL